MYTDVYTGISPGCRAGEEKVIKKGDRCGGNFVSAGFCSNSKERPARVQVFKKVYCPA